MDFEKWYSKLPSFIKYNSFTLEFFFKLSRRLLNINKKDKILKSQNQLFELILLNSNFEVKGTLKDIHLLYIELLRFIVNVCEKYDIEYWLSDGTLIGAIRHGGFIPWDDDIDLSIMRRDYNKLIEVLPKEISAHDYLKENCGLSLLRDNHENYYKNLQSVYDFEGDGSLLDSERFLFLQIAWMKPYVKIDFFPKDFVKDEKIDYFRKNYLATKYKFNQEVKYGKCSFENEFNSRGEKLGFSSNETSFICDGFDTLQLTPAWIWETDKIFPLETIEFEGIEFNCPKDIDHCLSVVYGPNYMHLPENIVSHNITPFIESQFNSKEEMDKKFKKDIEYLREINDNFE